MCKETEKHDHSQEERQSMGTYPKMTQILDLAEEVLKLLSLLKDTKDIMLIVNKRMNRKSWQRKTIKRTTYKL